MTLNPLKPKLALNKAFLKMKPIRSEFDTFKANLLTLLNHLNIDRSEEYHKNLISKFLADTYYKNDYFINVKDRQDLVIHNGSKSTHAVEVIIEAKHPTKNPGDMVSIHNLNSKAFHELILYYLRERITLKNLEIKHLIATNINEWFIFEATTFERLFAQNKQLVQQFQDFENGRLADFKTEFFYQQIAYPFLNNLDAEISFTHFNLQDYQPELKNPEQHSEKTLISLYKIFSPTHLLKLPITNDSNSLDKQFYHELLHIIGLTETKIGSKKCIERNPEGQRHPGTLIENTIVQLESLDKLSRVSNVQNYGSSTQEQLFNVALELSITWINRILFLKLLEAQLILYNSNALYAFLNFKSLKLYEDLNSLFFQVLAKQHDQRNSNVKLVFEKVPYLNSSLFEPTEMEQLTLFISNLSDNLNLPILTSTVLKDGQGRKRTGDMNALEYLFEFLDAYDFGSEEANDIQEQSKTLINASVLGLIFEKINGYKEGSFFTPGFITMYMCRETIRKAVVQKFNETKHWQCIHFDELYNKIDDIEEANNIVNSLKICDPAVGSGHFLVSALNEIIAIKHDLKILKDKTGKRLKEYQVLVENDELVITDDNGELFLYKPFHPESQRIQETLFHEKQTIIEHCLFGVDINTNSVKICRLRLWIELLKHAYYKNHTELETLPNIDINIKCGNSLISRYGLDVDLKQVLKKSKWTIESYQMAVDTYRNAENKAQKREMEALILSIKQSFTTEISMSNPLKTRLDKLASELYRKFTGRFLFESQAEYDTSNDASEKKRLTEQEKLEIEIKELNAKWDDLKSNKMYEQAFEWRFEFPEVLNMNGDFIGFDVVIGNPPYIKEYEGKEIFNCLKDNIIYQGKTDIWYLFSHLGINLLKKNGLLCFIATNNWTTNAGASKFRNFLLENVTIIEMVDFNEFMVFDSASIQTMILSILKFKQENYSTLFKKLLIKKPQLEDVLLLLNGANFENNLFLKPLISKDKYLNKSFTFNVNKEEILLVKIAQKSNFKLDEIQEVAQGIVPNPDIVNLTNINKISPNKILTHNIKVGDGVFVIDKGFFGKLTSKESKYIKPLYEPYLVLKYTVNNFNKELIYISKKNYKQDAPKLIAHLEKYKEIMNDRRENKNKLLEFYHLHWSRNPYFFEEGEKILCVRKCEQPTFAYTENEAYVMMSFNVIRSTRINLKYLTSLLNSKLIKFWLKRKGKMQGANFQIDKEPILDLPLVNPDFGIQNKCAALVSKIIEKKLHDSTANTTALETKIDALVYKIYNLTPEEIQIIENNV